MKEDNVNHPKHYTSHPSGVECITITEHMSFLRGNALKYLWRADEKNGLEDLKKAAWYLNREIEKQEPKGALLSPTRPMLVQNSVGDVVRDAPAPLGAKRGRKAKQSPEDLREPMIAFVKKHPGCKAEQIREAIGAKPTQMPVLRVLTNHAVRTKGAKRATTYWPRGGK